MLVEPGAGSRPLIHLIDGAERLVFVETYILSDARVIRALQRAAAAGVRVYVLLEPHPLGMGTQSQSVANRLRAAGVHVRWAWSRFRLTHAKFMVLDDRVLVVSTANFSRSAFASNREFLMVIKERSVVRQGSSIFRSDWDRLPAQLRDANVVLAPRNARSDLTAILRRAVRHVEVYGEELLDPRVEAQFARLVTLGVRVRVLLPTGSAVLHLPALLARGVEVRFRATPYIHAKAILVDGTRGFVGSENMSAASLDANREFGIVIRGSNVRAIYGVFTSDWRSSQPAGNPAAGKSP